VTSSCVAQALASWPQWRVELSAPPSIVGQLRGGFTNRAYRVRANAREFVLRLSHANAASLGINRANEYEILSCLAPTGIAPELVYWSPDGSIAVFEYISGRVWNRADFALASQRRRLSALVDCYQRIAPDVPCFSYVQYLSLYWRQYQKRFPARARVDASKWHRFMHRLRLWEQHQSLRTLVHHDLVPENIIETPAGLRIIDWEYAGLGLAALDRLVLHPRGVRYRAHRGAMCREIASWIDTLWWAIR